MRVIGVIPARWASQRFPGKVLVKLLGKPLIQLVWERAKLCPQLDELFIAYDDERIMHAAQKFGAQVIRTKEDHPSGTDRIVEAVRNIPADIVINIQADEPLFPTEAVEALAYTLIKDPSFPVATVMKRIEIPEELDSPNVVKVVFDHKYRALYFSRFAIPFNRDKINFHDIEHYKHIGMYAFRRDFLLKFSELPESNLERWERLEQLRILESGYPIKMIKLTQDSWGVDVPADLDLIKQKLILLKEHG